MRRAVVVALATVATAGAALGATAAPASAHICPQAVQIPVGRPSTIHVGVTVEDATVPDVEIGIPAGLRLDRVDTEPGWTSTRAGSAVRYRGGPIAPFACAYFSLGVTATSRGAFGISVVQRTATGKIVARVIPDPGNAADRSLDQFVYAGVEPPSPPGDSSGASATTIAGIALVGLGVVMLLALLVRARRRRRRASGDEGEDDTEERSRPDRDAELRARLERFTKRTKDPPPP